MASTPQVRHYTVDAESAGQRLDNFLLRELKGVPKTHVYRIIRSGEVRVNKGRASADTLAAQVQALGAQARVVPDADAAMPHCPLIATCTTGKAVVLSAPPRPDTFIAAVGAFTPAMVELAKKRSEGVEDFDYMIGHTNIPQKDDLIKACRKAFGKDPLITFPLGGVVSANTGPDTIALVYVGHAR